MEDFNIEELEGSEIDKKLAEEVFATLSKLDGVEEYLRQTMVEDIKRYFSAPDDISRERIKGHYALASYMRRELIAAR